MSTPRPSEADVEAVVKVLDEATAYTQPGRGLVTLNTARAEAVLRYFAAWDAEHEREVQRWRSERDEYVSSICFETTCTNCAHMLDVLAASQDLEDAGDLEAAKSRRIRTQQEALRRLREDRDTATNRAEAAERALADLRGEIKALAADFDTAVGFRGAATSLRALLPRDDAAGAGGAG